MLAERLEFVPQREAEIFAATPAAPAVFSLRGADERADPYISKTANLRRRLQRLLGPPDERTKRLNLRDRIGWIEYTATGSDFESGFLLYKLLRAHFPQTYSARLRLRFAPLVKLHLENETINISSRDISFDRFTLVDSAGNKAVINGKVFTTDYKSFSFDLDLSADMVIPLSQNVPQLSASLRPLPTNSRVKPAAVFLVGGPERRYARRCSPS